MLGVQAGMVRCGQSNWHIPSSVPATDPVRCCAGLVLGHAPEGCVHASRRLSLADRATMVPLLAALVDYDSSPATYRRFDQMTALELFQKCDGPDILLATDLIQCPVCCTTLLTMRKEVRKEWTHLYEPPSMI